MQRKLICFIALTAFICSLAGCSGGDDNTPPPPANNINWDQMQWDKDNWSSLFLNETEMPS